MSRANWRHPPLTAIAQTQDPDQASGPGFPITRMTYEDDHEVRLLKAAIAEQGEQIASLNAAFAEQIGLRDRRALGAGRRQVLFLQLKTSFYRPETS